MTPAGTSTNLTSKINGMTSHTHTDVVYCCRQDKPYWYCIMKGKNILVTIKHTSFVFYFIFWKTQKITQRANIGIVPEEKLMWVELVKKQNPLPLVLFCFSTKVTPVIFLQTYKGV